MEATLATLEENKRHWAQYEWSQQGEEWSTHWGGSDVLWWSGIFPRIRYYLPATNVLEIACGYGRLSQYLLKWSGRFTGIDITPKAIDSCRSKFSSHGHARFLVGDGSTLDAVPDDSIDFAFSWDSLVHCSAETVESYLDALSRKLHRGGAAFLHHSNLASLEGQRLENDHFRDPGMSAPKLTAICDAVGLHCVTQELLPWGAVEYLDCISLVGRPEAGAQKRPPRVFYNPWWCETISRARHIHDTYRQTTGAPAEDPMVPSPPSDFQEAAAHPVHSKP